MMGLISIPEIKPNPAAVSSITGVSPPPQTAAGVWSFAGPANPSPGCNDFVGLNNNMQRYYYGNQIQENFLSFGGDQASCSSSDGGGGGGGSYGKEMGHFQNGFYGGVEDHHRKQPIGVMGNEGGWSEKEIGVWKEETPLECSFEEIKRLISCSDDNNNYNNNNNVCVSFDENYKSGERINNYYY